MQQLTKTIEFLSSRPDLAEKMGTAGLELVRQSYAPQSHYRALLGLYERLVVKNEARRGLQPILRQNKLRRSFAPVVATGYEMPGPTVRVEPPPVRIRTLRVNLESDNSFRPIIPRPKLCIAFIGGRGVISKYSGIETYYEEAGKRLGQLGHAVTVYCRGYFTPPLKEHSGMRLVRLPTIRSKHLETLVHTVLSTLHV